VTHRLILVACAALSFSAGPAFALKHMAGCDIVAFAAKDSPVAIAPERWQAYREAFLASLAAAAGDAGTEGANPRPLAASLIAAQKDLLAPDQGSQAYQDYLSGDSCRVLAKLDSTAVDALAEEAAHTAPEGVGSALKWVTEAARTQIDRIERTARFRSLLDRTAMSAEYYCFVAGAIMALLPPERREAVTLEDFGETVACRDVGRTG
jgi:hypothetical protein